MRRNGIQTKDTEKVQVQGKKGKSSPCPANIFTDVSQRLWKGKKKTCAKHIVKPSLLVSNLYILLEEIVLPLTLNLL